MKIAWIGTGVMGKSMLLHLVHGGHSVSAYNRTKAKALDLAKDGVKVCDSIEECVSDAELVCTMVGYPKDVVEVYQKIFSAVQAGTILIDFTTSSPKLAQQLYKEAKNHGLDILDAPVSGGDSGAKAATLSIMVGGDKKYLKQLRQFYPYLAIVCIIWERLVVVSIQKPAIKSLLLVQSQP